MFTVLCYLNQIVTFNKIYNGSSFNIIAGTLPGNSSCEANLIYINNKNETQYQNLTFNIYNKKVVEYKEFY